jgi:hypothetical protein
MIKVHNFNFMNLTTKKYVFFLFLIFNSFDSNIDDNKISNNIEKTIRQNENKELQIKFYY